LADERLSKVLKRLDVIPEQRDGRSKGTPGILPGSDGTWDVAGPTE